MKYLVSFRTTLRISRYLFRALALMLWTLGALLTAFFIINVLHEKESQVRQEFSANYDQAQWYIHHSTDVTRELKYIAENRLNSSANGMDMLNGVFPGKATLPQFYPLYADSDCSSMSSTWRSSLESLSYFLNYWKANFSSAYELNRVFFIGGESLCLADFGIGSASVDRERALKSLNERILRYRNSNTVERKNSLYWIASTTQPGVGYFYMITPVYVANKLEALLGIEQNIRLDDFIAPGNLPVVATIIDQNNQPILSSARNGVSLPTDSMPDDKAWFGYLDGYKQLVLKKTLQPSSLSVVYSISTDVLVSQLKMLMINALLLNFLSGIVLFSLAWLFERRMFLPAEDNAHRLEEHEQFNRKIVASAPVGICILRTSDGTNILSNELAHNYLSLLTQEDRQRLTEIICGQQVNFVDVLTGSNTNLQISFVHSRYRNENVAICVLVDVSARVKMEESLQEMAQAAEQASQSKSMFLATVSHELRTPLYGIIGNLDLLQTKALPKGVESLVTAMTNSSSLLLKIISDILDFSKIESEQLRIEPREFSPREIITHIASNYLSLVVKKRLTLYCFIDSKVPISLDGDPLRLQQVISNLLNNAIKFTHTGCIILHAYVKEGYLAFRVRDTGVGIPAKEITRLFDPFFQVGTGVQRNFQGTGLGLAICEKLINMMDGDIEVDSEPGMGSQFIIRIPLYNSQVVAPPLHEGLQDKQVWLELRNEYLASFLESLLHEHGIQVYRYDESRYGSDDVIITDYDFIAQRQVRAVIEFDGLHIDMPQEVSSGRWVYSTATPHELPALLGRIYRVPLDVPEGLALAPVAEESVNNEDILILVVDDHPINRMLLSDQLGSLGFRVKTAQDGVDALNVISRSEIDIVLSDVNMPNMDGYRLTQRLRQLGHTFPVIGVTANALAEEKQRCMEAGMDNCLSKPVTLDTLQKTLSFYAERVRKGREG
ncbi:two-component system sensor histidine kinase RcsC [Erwiniaceae bacterium BAC15a-03b]|uniref:Sensor histidine kinase RcsC n=1 Tax=Winslowiella arboricola TaxID=2978220 RepID=A0A9J6PN00_9GAMM|nr:two-component system sensor histidine kinase RcsC [Winslowiella arboricola]MCU5771337.1 two-component system sensor histidine kinase RcsC [Winslowiella arboricola]MCU5777032.1 two-component system sensor histidine kinase RcsC [Winslowiella arboricola]